MSYSDQINQCKSINDIIDSCYENISSSYIAHPWTHHEISHGIALLQSDEALNCYMAAYGEMHVEKCRAAMMTFPFDKLDGSIEIVDWGCGQGIGSATVFEILSQRELLPLLKRITLIEPSGRAIERAETNLRTLTNNRIIIDARNEYLPSAGSPQDNTLESIGYKCNNIIHIFSNILDIKALDLGAIARMVASSSGRHFVLCIGPKNSAAYRILQFCSVFGEQEYFSQIDDISFSRTRLTSHIYTCMTRCFVHNGASIDLSKISSIKENDNEVLDEYDLKLKIENKVMSIEKARVAYRLQNILAIDDIMYTDAVINEVKVDFIIIRPHKGILLITVFDKDLNQYTLTDDKKTLIGEDKTIQSPISLVNICQSSINEGIEELLMSTIKDKHNFSLIKKMVVFTKNSIDVVKTQFGTEPFVHLYGEEFIRCAEVSKILYQKIGFTNDQPTFDNAIIHRLSNILSPNYHSYQEGSIDMKPRGAQKELAKSSKTQQKISGVAGSGKTQVIAFRAINAMKRTGGNVLILTYNITLANYMRIRLSEVREDFAWSRIDIYHYHRFFRIRACECDLRVGFDSYQNVNFFDCSPNHKRYSAIFIDEVQDYDPRWLSIVYKYFLSEKDGEFVVFGDSKQNIFQRALDENGDIKLGIIGGKWNRQLTTNLRFTNPCLTNLASSFQRQFMKDKGSFDNIENGYPEKTLNFEIVNYIDLSEHYSYNNLFDNILNIINNDKNNVQDFVVLGSSTKLLREIDKDWRYRTHKPTEIAFVSTEQLERLKKLHYVEGADSANWEFQRDFEAIGRQRKQQFTTDKKCLKIATIQSFKGWESRCVIVILESVSSSGSFNPNSPETIYSAITRAREKLYIININSKNPYHEFFYNHAK